MRVMYIPTNNHRDCETQESLLCKQDKHRVVFIFLRVQFCDCFVHAHEGVIRDRASVPSCHSVYSRPGFCSLVPGDIPAEALWYKAVTKKEIKFSYLFIFICSWPVSVQPLNFENAQCVSSSVVFFRRMSCTSIFVQSKWFLCYTRYITSGKSLPIWYLLFTFVVQRKHFFKAVL